MNYNVKNSISVLGMFIKCSQSFHFSIFMLPYQLAKYVVNKFFLRSGCGRGLSLKVLSRYPAPHIYFFTQQFVNYLFLLFFYQRISFGFLRDPSKFFLLKLYSYTTTIKLNFLQPTCYTLSQIQRWPGEHAENPCGRK